MRMFAAIGALCVALVCAGSAARGAVGPTADDFAVPHYRNIFVIMGENKDWARIDGGADAPVLTRLAREYGDATAFYGEVHPSEANYIALIAGSTFGIHDDDAFYCTPGSTRPSCGGAAQPGYPTHALDAENLGTQLDATGNVWKSYLQSVPEDGSLAVTGSNAAEDGPNAAPYYASKHVPFLNFLSVQNDPHRADHLVGYAALRRDVAENTLPNFGLIIPNLCDDMHGIKAGPGVPENCRYDPVGPLIRRGDTAIGKLVTMLQGTAAWKSSENVAIVITFDEDDGTGRAGCCGVTPGAASNFGGGHIATIVVTNHGPHGISDATPYNHYSLLRTIEDAFGIHDYLGLAGASERGVRPMLPLFRTL